MDRLEGRKQFLSAAALSGWILGPPRAPRHFFKLSLPDMEKQGGRARRGKLSAPLLSALRFCGQRQLFSPPSRACAPCVGSSRRCPRPFARPGSAHLHKKERRLRRLEGIKHWFWLNGLERNTVQKGWQSLWIAGLFSPAECQNRRLKTAAPPGREKLI